MCCTPFSPRSANPQRPCQHLRRSNESSGCHGFSQAVLCYFAYFSLGAKFNWLARDVLPCLTSLSLNLLFLRFLALLPPFAVGWTSEAKLATRRTQSRWWNRNQWCNVELHCTGAFHRYGKTHDHCNFSSSYQPSDSSGVWFSVAYFKAIAPRVSWMNLVPGTGTWHWICSISKCCMMPPPTILCHTLMHRARAKGSSTSTIWCGRRTCWRRPLPDAPGLLRRFAY